MSLWSPATSLSLSKNFCGKKWVYASTRMVIGNSLPGCLCFGGRFLASRLCAVTYREGTRLASVSRAITRAGIAADPDARLEPFHGKRAVMRHAVLHFKTRPPTTDHCALDRNVVTVAGR